MGTHTAAEITGLARRSLRFPAVRVLAYCVVAAAAVLVLVTEPGRAETNKNENLINLGIMQAPILKPFAAGIYVRLLISLQVAEDVDRRSVTRHLTRLRDTVMLDLHQNPIPPFRKDDTIDVTAIEHRLLAKVTEVVGARKIERVRVYEVTKNQVCDKDAPVGAWSSGCVQK
jgi:hypothetical protein